MSHSDAIWREKVQTGSPVSHRARQRPLRYTETKKEKETNPHCEPIRQALTLNPHKRYARAGGSPSHWYPNTCWDLSVVCLEIPYEPRLDLNSLGTQPRLASKSNMIFLHQLSAGKAQSLIVWLLRRRHRLGMAEEGPWSQGGQMQRF